MAWFKVDDHFWSHPKTAELSDGATALWLRAGSWAAGHLTDGVVPVSMLRLFRARRRSADELIAAGLWSFVRDTSVEPSSHAGDTFVFTSWHEYQPSKAQVEARREATKTRVNTWRQGKGNGVTETFTDGPRNAPPDPTRPDPTRKEAKASLKEHPIPADWTPTAEHIAKAKELGIDVKREAEVFRLHAESKGRKAVRWNAAFSMWLTKATPTQTASKVDPRDEWKFNR